MQHSLTALVAWSAAPLTHTLVLRAIEALDSPVSIVSSADSLHIDDSSRLLQWSSYDEIDHELTSIHRDTVLSSTYTFRKALIRKHFLSHCIRSYLTKNPASILAAASPQTFEIEISFADELDEMFADELYELSVELDDSDKWWILKPGMADRGNGIRLFNSRDTLEQIFREFDESDDEGEEDNADANDTAVITSQLRHFVIQRYLPDPLLLDPSEAPIPGSSAVAPTELKGHKFHLRAYCVSSGALTLYLYDRILALFSAVPYEHPVAETEDGDSLPIDLAPHLTNTSLQTERGEEGVRLLDDLVGCSIYSGDDATEKATLTSDDVSIMVGQMSNILAETFKAALSAPIHFQASPNAFELFGVDFLVTLSPSSPLQVHLLEINAEPAIELTGPRLTWILEDLFIAIGKVCVEPFFSNERHEGWSVGDNRHHLIKCLEEEVRGFPGRESRT